MMILSSRMNLRERSKYPKGSLYIPCCFVKAVQSAVHARADIGLVEVDAKLLALVRR